MSKKNYQKFTDKGLYSYVTNVTGTTYHSTEDNRRVQGIENILRCNKHLDKKADYIDLEQGPKVKLLCIDCAEVEKKDKLTPQIDKITNHISYYHNFNKTVDFKSLQENPTEIYQKINLTTSKAVEHFTKHIEGEKNRVKKQFKITLEEVVKALNQKEEEVLKELDNRLEMFKENTEKYRNIINKYKDEKTTPNSVEDIKKLAKELEEISYKASDIATLDIEKVTQYVNLATSSFINDNNYLPKVSKANEVDLKSFIKSLKSSLDAQFQIDFTQSVLKPETFNHKQYHHIATNTLSNRINENRKFGRLTSDKTETYKFKIKRYSENCRLEAYLCKKKSDSIDIFFNELKNTSKTSPHLKSLKIDTFGSKTHFSTEKGLKEFIKLTSQGFVELERLSIELPLGIMLSEQFWVSLQPLLRIWFPKLKVFELKQHPK